MPKRFNKRIIREAPRKLYAYIPKNKGKFKNRRRPVHSWPAFPECENNPEVNCARRTNPTKGECFSIFKTWIMSAQTRV